MTPRPSPPPCSAVVVSLRTRLAGQARPAVPGGWPCWSADVEVQPTKACSRNTPGSTNFAGRRRVHSPQTGQRAVDLTPVRPRAVPRLVLHSLHDRVQAGGRRYPMLADARQSAPVRPRRRTGRTACRSTAPTLGFAQFISAWPSLRRRATRALRCSRRPGWTPSPANSRWKTARGGGSSSLWLDLAAGGRPILGTVDTLAERDRPVRPRLGPPADPAR